MSPSRIGGKLTWRGGADGVWYADLGVTHVFAQERVAAFESATPGYTRVDASVLPPALRQQPPRGSLPLGKTWGPRHPCPYVVPEGCRPLAGRSFILSHRLLLAVCAGAAGDHDRATSPTASRSQRCAASACVRRCHTISTALAVRQTAAEFNRQQFVLVPVDGRKCRGNTVSNSEPATTRPAVKNWLTVITTRRAD